MREEQLCADTIMLCFNILTTWNTVQFNYSAKLANIRQHCTDDEAPNDVESVNDIKAKPADWQSHGKFY